MKPDSQENQTLFSEGNVKGTLIRLAWLGIQIGLIYLFAQAGQGFFYQEF